MGSSNDICSTSNHRLCSTSNHRLCSTSNHRLRCTSNHCLRCPCLHWSANSRIDDRLSWIWCSARRPLQLHSRSNASCSASSTKEGGEARGACKEGGQASPQK